MCGIAGILYKDRKVTQEKMQKVLGTLAHRGPDGGGTYIRNNVGLGMNRLAIIDTEEHTIPFSNEDGTLHLVYNGEIYNHDEICRKLKKKHTIKYNSDSETILHAWEEYGLEIVKMFNGMYAFAVYDEKEGVLTLVRDKVGEKPLYYYFDGSELIFASEIKAIVKVVKPDINPKALTYKTFEFCCGEETLFKNTYCLQPGEALIYKNGGITLKKYWKIYDNLIDVKDDEKQIVEDLTELMEDSILLRKKNNVHSFGCLVSGGVDSALVACISKPDFIYTGTYDINESFNELPYAQLVAKHIKKDMVVVKPQKEDYLRYKDEILYHLDMPCTWTSFNMFMVLKRAKEDIRVVLSGEGVDELFGGYHRYHLLDHDQKIFKLKAMEKYNYMIQKYYGTPESRYAKLINRNINQFDEDTSRYLHELTTYYFSKTESIIHGMGIVDFYTTMQVLLKMSDNMSMAFSIENRSPFLDYRLVQYAFSMPDKYKIKDGITKYMIKKIAERFIPKEIADRVDKRGFAAPVNLWFDWRKNGQYGREQYKESVYADWRKIFFKDADNNSDKIYYTN